MSRVGSTPEHFARAEQLNRSEQTWVVMLRRCVGWRTGPKRGRNPSSLVEWPTNCHAFFQLTRPPVGGMRDWVQNGRVARALEAGWRLYPEGDAFALPSNATSVSNARTIHLFRNPSRDADPADPRPGHLTPFARTTYLLVARHATRTPRPKTAESKTA